MLSTKHDTIYFIPKNFENRNVVTLYPYDIYTDGNSYLAVFDQKFIGLYNSIKSFENSLLNRINIDSIPQVKNKSNLDDKVEVLLNFKNVDRVDVYQVWTNNPWQKDNFTLSELTGKLSDLLRNLPKQHYQNVNQHTIINVEGWSNDERQFLIKEVLEHIYRNFLEKPKVFKASTITTYFKLIDCLELKTKSIYLEDLDIYNYSVRNFLSKKGYYHFETPHFNRESETFFNTEYYNDSLDLDQQSPDFWNNL